MKLLVDTHYLLWMFMDTGKISPKIKQALLSEQNEVYYSPVSLWEISIKYGIGKLTLQGITPDALYGEIENSFLLCHPLNNEVLASSYRLPREHNDPFDRLIVWQAIKSGMTLLSADGKMTHYVPHGLKLFSE